MSLDDPEPTREKILEATYEALCKHGYGDLTIQDIADEFEKSKSLLYYHYDSKDRLLVDFLDSTLEEFITDFHLTEETPREQLERLLDRLFPNNLDEENYPLQIALLELRAQAHHSELYQKQFTEMDRLFKETLVDIIEEGIRTGQFRDVDAELEAELLVSMISGMRTRRLTCQDFQVEESRRAIEEHIDRRLRSE